MIKRLFITIFVTTIALALVTGCKNPSDEEEPFYMGINLDSEYSQIILTWLTDGTGQTEYFVYASKENDVSKLTEYKYRGTSDNTKFTVDEPGHYYVWVKAGENGPFGNPGEIDVNFLEPAKNLTVKRIPLGLKLSWDNQHYQSCNGSYTKIAYKETSATEWSYVELDEYDSDVDFYRFNYLEEGNYIFKVIITDIYDTEIPSEETVPVHFKFDSDKYGNKPDSFEYEKIEFEQHKTMRELTGEVDYYYFNAEKGKTYTINFLDASPFRDTYSYFDDVDKNMLVLTDCHIFIAGACPFSKDDSIEPDWDGNCLSINKNTQTFTCELDACYIIRVCKFPLPGISPYNKEYGLDITEIPQQ